MFVLVVCLVYVQTCSTLPRFGKDIILRDNNNYREAYEVYILTFIFCCYRLVCFSHSKRSAV